MSTSEVYSLKQTKPNNFIVGTKVQIINENIELIMISDLTVPNAKDIIT